MLDLRIQALLHPTGHLLVLQQTHRRPLQVAHVHPVARALEFGKAGAQSAHQMRHVVVMLPGGLVLQRGLDLDAQGLRAADVLDAGDFVGELARLAFLREQCVQRGWPVSRS